MTRRKTARKANIQTAKPTLLEKTILFEASNSSLDSRNEVSARNETRFSTTGLTLSQKISLDAKRVKSMNCKTNFEYRAICEYTDEVMRSFKPKDAADELLIKDIINLDHISTKYMQEAVDMRWSHQFRHEHLKLATKAMALKQKLIETIDKRNGRGQQNINVKHFRVEAGANAMVGNFNAAAPSDLSPEQNEQISPSELTISNAPSEQVRLASPKKKNKRQ